MAPILELQIPARPEYVGIVRLVASSLAAARREVADERVDDLKLAVSEACTNAIEVHRANEVDAPVTIRVTEAQDRIEVTVTDGGPGFDPDELPVHRPVTDPDRLNFERGLGIPLMRTLVDELSFSSGPDGTVVTMTLFGGPAGDDATSEILRSVLEGE